MAQDVLQVGEFLFALSPVLFPFLFGLACLLLGYGRLLLGLPGLVLRFGSSRVSPTV